MPSATRMTRSRKWMRPEKRKPTPAILGLFGAKAEVRFQPKGVVGVYLPENYGTKAKVGITGIRQRLGVYDRPLVMAIFKPALGLSAQDHADILREVAFAGSFCQNRHKNG